MSQQQRLSQRLSQRQSHRFIIPGTRTRRAGLPIPNTPSKDGDGPQQIEDFFNLSDDEFQSPSVTRLTPSRRPHHRFSLNSHSFTRSQDIEGNNNDVDDNEEDKDEDEDVSKLDIPTDNSGDNDSDDTDADGTGDRLISSAASLGSPIRPPRSFRDYNSSNTISQTEATGKRLSTIRPKETSPVGKSLASTLLYPSTTLDSTGKSLAPSPIKKTKAKVGLPPDSTAINNGTDTPNGKSKVTETEDVDKNANEEEAEPIDDEEAEEIEEPKRKQVVSDSKTQKKESESHAWASMMKNVALTKPKRSIKRLVYNDISDESDDDDDEEEDDDDSVDPESSDVKDQDLGAQDHEMIEEDNAELPGVEDQTMDEQDPEEAIDVSDEKIQHITPDHEELPDIPQSVKKK
ncbi:unnamed protein product [Ambrosiozyma monospora]|uniref:Unnamed protein product n=1 Tax=Ambrosiozyma monospora TaxID=43982 RepID=A0A9W6YPS1_AMBMO|nr:unnamed protein product [Ambrosiozyma monospora]